MCRRGSGEDFHESADRALLGVTSLLRREEVPGQEAAGSGRSERRAGRGTGQGAGQAAEAGRQARRQRVSEERRGRGTGLSPPARSASCSRLGPRRGAFRPAGGAAEAPWAHCWGRGGELGPPRGAQGCGARGRLKGPAPTPLSLGPGAPLRAAAESREPTSSASVQAWGCLGARLLQGPSGHPGPCRAWETRSSQETAV